MSPSRRTSPTVTGLREQGFLAFRSELGIHQRDCAERVTEGGAAIKRSTWDAWERRERPMNLDQLRGLKEGFQLSERQIVALLQWWWADEAAAAA